MLTFTISSSWAKIHQFNLTVNRTKWVGGQRAVVSIIRNLS